MSDTRIPDEAPNLSAVACDIAVSEMFGIPLEKMCNYAVVALEHNADDGTHALWIIGLHDNWPYILKLLRAAVRDLENSL